MHVLECVKIIQSVLRGYLYEMNGYIFLIIMVLTVCLEARHSSILKTVMEIAFLEK